MNKRIYIAGKVTGLPMALCAKKFLDKKMELIAQGYTVVNPIDVVAELAPVKVKWADIDWLWAMKVTMREMLTCDAIYMLPDWIDSKGATIEHEVAKMLGMEVIYQTQKQT